MTYVLLLSSKKEPTLSVSYQNEAVNKIEMNENIRFSVLSLKQAQRALKHTP